MPRPFAAVLVAFLSLVPRVSLANGGGYAFGVDFTGSVAPFQASGTDDVQILTEKLDIALGRTAAAVVVRYELRSSAEQPARVRFGFPVEALGGGDEEDGWAEPGEYPRNLRESYQQLRDYSVAMDGKPVKAELLIEPFSTGKVKPFRGSKALEGIAAWMVSEVTFPPAQTVQLEIRYRADYMGETLYVSDDVTWPTVKFVYRLSTGAVWKGPIGEGTVTLRADGISPDEVSIETAKKRFVRDGATWTWSFRELEPTLADDITIYPSPGYKELFDYSSNSAFMERAGRWGARHQRFAARASSTLAPGKLHGYGAEHLAEREAEAPWVEGVPGHGVGEWVELAPARPKPLLALRIVPGFRSPERRQLFQANGRPAKVEILLNGEHRFIASLGDEPSAQLVPIIGYEKPVKTLRLTILEVYAGTKYEDTCITRVELYDRLAIKPDVQGAR